MANRRELLYGGLALPVLALAQGSLAKIAAAAVGPQALQIERFVFDVRFAESGAIAQLVERLGVALSPIADDLMSLWYDDLDLRWRQAPMALAGVTLEETLFVLETFALDRGMHVVYRGRHGLVEDGRIAHRLTGPEPMLRRFTPLTSAWEDAVALAVAECPLGTSTMASTEFVSAGATLSLRDMPLHSWIIAPRTAVAAMARS